ncbi:MAG: aminotransferase class I/II-fold pyridoxal phosphate-dependent enzyme [Chloroflexi bacterium]|nr:aminotransferase class I/II-fold pyridoxal phosphate-dependent enzyme [Chloroflexota bacterium]
MNIPPFKLERYFAEYEFKVKYLLSPSDCEGYSMSELLAMADSHGLAYWNTLKLGYTESPGHLALRAEIAGLYQTMMPEDVVVAVPEEAIFIAMNTLLKPGDHLVTIFPAYQSLYELASAIGCQVTRWPVELVDGEWRLDLTRLEDGLTDRTRLIVLNFPHNPTGFLPSRADLDSIIALARKYGLTIFCDEMYRLLEHDPARRLPAMCDLYEKGISLSGLSKSFALPGLRVGWLATQDRALVDRWLTFKDYTTICNSAPSEALGIIALRAKQTIVARNLEIIQSNVKVAEAFFAAHSDQLQWIKPLAGSIAFPRWLAAKPVETFCQEMLDQHGVMIVPGSIFDYPSQLHDQSQHFRVGLGRLNFPEALERVRDYFTPILS